jgi:hypothetical protein
MQVTRIMVVLCIQTGNSVSHGVLEESERIQSSTWRRLVAVERALCSLLPSWKARVQNGLEIILMLFEL